MNEWYLIMSPYNRTLINGVSRPKLVNKPFASCFFANLDVIVSHTENFGCVIFFFQNSLGIGS